MRARSLTDEIGARSCTYADRRGGAGIRRNGRGGGCGKPSKPLAAIYGATGFDTANRLGSALGGGYRGSLTGHTIACAFRINAQVSGAYVLDYLDATGKGWSLWQETGTTLRWRNANAAGNGWFVSAPYSPAADIGKVQISILTYTGGAGYIGHWCGDERVGGDVAVDGYTLPQTTVRQVIGVRSNGTAAHTGIDIFGWGAWGRCLTDDEIHGIYAAFAKTGKLPVNLSNTAQCCNIVDSVSGAAFPATVIDTAPGGGGGSFTFVTGASTGIDLLKLDGPVIA